MRAPFQFAPDGSRRLLQAASLLETIYDDVEIGLENKDDALDEAVYIILSFQTKLERFKSTWARLKLAFPTWQDLEMAPAMAIEDVLRFGGLHRQKAHTIKLLLAAVRREMGELSLEGLRNLNEDEAERVLLRLPGISLKAARCILMYSLGRDKFPIDSNAFRILQRLGVLDRSAVYRRRSLHDGVEEAIPPARRKELHVNLVVHGQRVCSSVKPRCSNCGLISICEQTGVSLSRREAITGTPSSSDPKKD